MEDVFTDSIAILALMGVVQGLSEGMFSVMPFLAKLKTFQPLVKRVVVLGIALSVVFGFQIDLSATILQTEPVTATVGFVFTAMTIAFGSSVAHSVGKRISKKPL